MSKPIHPIVREIIEEEIQARGWKDAALVVSELAGTSLNNARRLLVLHNRLTHVQCWMMDKAFGLSEGFFSRLQKNAEEKYPQGAQ